MLSLLPKLNNQEISHKIRMWADRAHSHQRRQGCTKDSSVFLNQAPGPCSRDRTYTGLVPGHSSPGPQGRDCFHLCFAERESQRSHQAGESGCPLAGLQGLFPPYTPQVPELTPEDSNQGLPLGTPSGPRGVSGGDRKGWGWDGLYAGLGFWGYVGCGGQAAYVGARRSRWQARPLRKSQGVRGPPSQPLPAEVGRY